MVSYYTKHKQIGHVNLELRHTKLNPKQKFLFSLQQNYLFFFAVHIIYRDIRYRIINLIDDMEKFPENVIHVTGFGVFRGFTSINPSWEAVKQMPDHINYNGQTIQIVKHQVPVTYDAVDKKIHEIWANKPMV